MSEPPDLKVAVKSFDVSMYSSSFLHDYINKWYNDYGDDTGLLNVVGGHDLAINVTCKMENILNHH